MTDRDGRAPLVIAAAQPLCVPYDVAANAAAHAAAVRAAGARVMVFPELSLTGYELDAPELDADDPRLEPLVLACAETGTLALAGAPVRGGAGPHIAVLAVGGTGATVAYRKVCLGGSEGDRFAPGGEPVVLDVDGWRLGLAVCKDTGVARHAADTVALGADVYVAGILEHVDETGLHDGRARRIAADHGVWVVMASFAGGAGGGYDRAAGRSSVWAPGGELLAQVGPETGAVVRATLSADTGAADTGDR